MAEKELTPFILGPVCEGPGSCQRCDECLKSADQKFRDAVECSLKKDGSGVFQTLRYVADALREVWKRRHVIPNRRYIKEVGVIEKDHFPFVLKQLKEEQAKMMEEGVI